MRREQKSLFASALEDGAEFGGRVVTFVGVQADTNDGVFEGESFHECGHGVLGGLVPEEAQNQACRDTKRTLCHQETQSVATDDGRKWDATGSVGLRVEEEFDMFDVLSMGAGEVVQGQVAEVVFCLEDGEVRVVDGQERG